jgi:prephenate dehydrogenase
MPLENGCVITPLRRVGIAGIGLIGTSIALAARRRWPDVTIAGVDVEGVLAHPHAAAAVDRASSDLLSLAGSDLIVLAMPVDAVIEALPRLAGLGPETAVTDTGSTKRAIVRAGRIVAGFVGGHPMAGAERSGPGAARADLFDGRPWWIVPGAERPTSLVRAFVEGLGARPLDVDPDHHDALVAAVSHLPQIVASALMNRVGLAAGTEGLGHAGAGLRDATRLADSSAEMWASVLATNADRIAPLVQALASDLQEIAGQLESAGHGARDQSVRRLFEEAARWRSRLGS